MKLGKVRALAVKEYRQAARDPLTLAMLLGLPTMMLLLYGYAVNFDVRHVRLAVQDRDKSAASRDLESAFVNSGYFDLAADLPAGADLQRLTERRQAMAILVIPESYGRDLAAGRTASVQLVLDGADANTATTVLGYATAVAAEVNVEVRRAAAHSGEGDLLVRSLENTILHWADYTFWRVVEAGDQFAEKDPWLEGETSGRSGGPLR